MPPDRDSTLHKFDFPSATHTVRSLKNDSAATSEKSTVVIHGHLNQKPKHMGKRAFAHVRDTNGDLIQIHLNQDSTPANILKAFKSFGTEDAIVVSGVAAQKLSPQAELEIVVSDIHLLNKGSTDAAQLDKLKHSDPASIPPKFRYLQLRTPFYQKALRARSGASHLVRKVLVEQHSFVEIETPALFKSTPEGAREFLVPARSRNRFYALPQSPQQYKQMLMSSGFSRYFQMARCFRDEDLRADRQPEFTQVDLEMSFVNSSQQVHAVIDDIIVSLWRDIAKKSMYRLNSRGNLVEVDQQHVQPDTPAFSAVTYKEALLKYGIDKPDLRYNLAFSNLSEFFAPASHQDSFPVVEACILRQVLQPDNDMSVPALLTKSKNYPRRAPMVIPIKSDDDVANWWKPLAEKGALVPRPSLDEKSLQNMLNLKKGDVIAFSSRAELPYENPTPLGRFRQLAIEEFPSRNLRPIESEDGSVKPGSSDDIFVGSWLVDFPLFSPVDVSPSPTDPFPTYSKTQLESTHHPFTMAKTEDYEHLANDPLKVRGEHYDLVINGVEVGGGSRRIHDPELQLYVFEQILKIDNHHHLFGHLIRALSMGCPPHAGIALGFDRLCAMLVGTSSIKDVIAFPKNQSGVDAVVESPTAVPESTLKEYYIRSI